MKENKKKINKKMPELLAQKAEIDRLIALSDKRIKRMENIPSEKIRIMRCNGCYQYYEWHNGKLGKYIHTSNMEYVKKVLQKDYELKANRVLKNLDKELARFLEKYDFGKISALYDKGSQGRKNMIIPIIQGTDEFIDEWMKKNEGLKNPYQEKGKYMTERGGFVRSKSEKIIADLLYKHKIPYQYEPELKLSSTKVVYPDFVTLNVVKRKTIYWEHLGLASDELYASKNMAKLDMYEKAGYAVGDRLLISIETSNSPIDIKLIEKKIIEYLVN